MVTGLPLNSTWPASGLTEPKMIFMSVDLPAPFSPISPWMLPAATANEIARFACTAPKRLSIARNSSAGKA
eukprot:gene44716-54684_t